MTLILWIRKRPLLSFLLIALVLRLIVFVNFASAPGLFQSPDSDGYLKLAQTLKDHGSFSYRYPTEQYETFRTPGYPAYIAFWFYLFGEHEWIVVLSQIVLGLLTIYVTGRFGRECFNSYTGNIAALILAISPIQIYHNNLLLTETLATFLIVIAFYLAWRAAKDFCWRFALLSGLLLGYSVLVRPFGMLLYPILLLFFLLALWRNWRYLILIALMWIIGYAVPVEGWKYRNYVQVGQSVLTTIGGYNLLESRAAFVESLRTGKSVEQTVQDLYAELDRRGEGKNWTPPEREAAAKELSVNLIQENPQYLLRAIFDSVSHLFVQINGAFYFRFFHHSKELGPLPIWEKPILFLWALAQGLILLPVYFMALLGTVFMLRRQWWKELALTFLPSIYPMVILLGAYTAHSRYRVPFEPFIVLLTGVGMAVFAFRFVPKPKALAPLPQKPRTVLCIPVYNEKEKITRLLTGFPFHLVDQVVLVDDGSSDGTTEVLRQYPAHIIRHEQNQGIGKAIRDAIDYGRENKFDIFLVMAGNAKDDPAEMPKLLEPILQNGKVYVQGSRFMEQGHHHNTPLFRLVMIQLYTWIFNFLSPFFWSDLTNGYRAYRLDLFDDPRINLHQPWLERYELEYYIHFKAIMLDYPVAEVPVHKRYPESKKVSYSKIRPLVDWWKMVRPMVYLFLRIKK